MRTFMHVCTAGCVHRSKDHSQEGPMLLSEDELDAHDDGHLPSRVRVLVRMLRDVDPKVRAAVLGYFRRTGSGKGPAYAKKLTEPTTDQGLLLKEVQRG